jgi:hypothetical protein
MINQDFKFIDGSENDSISSSNQLTPNPNSNQLLSNPLTPTLQSNEEKKIKTSRKRYTKEEDKMIFESVSKFKSGKKKHFNQKIKI